MTKSQILGTLKSQKVFTKFVYFPMSHSPAKYVNTSKFRNFRFQKKKIGDKNISYIIMDNSANNADFGEKNFRQTSELNSFSNYEYCSNFFSSKLVRRKQSWGARACRSRVILAPWSRSRLEKKSGAGAVKN